MKTKINEIASKFATVLAVALVGWSAVAGIVVQKAQKDQVWNDELIVINVTADYSSEFTSMTNYTDAVVASATNGIRSVDGAARPLPKYLHALDFDDTYPAEAAWYYAQPQPYGACSARRVGNLLERNYDWKFDDAAEFVVKVSAGPGRFASVGVANCGTNLTEDIVTSGQPARYYKCLPGRVVDGINENGVVAEVNVVDGDPHEGGWPTTGTIHCMGAVRWVLDNATNAASAAQGVAAGVFFPSGWRQNFHYMLADERETWIVENGTASNVTAVAAKRVMTNFPILPDTYEGMGKERYQLLFSGEPITNAWFTRAYSPLTNWTSDFKDEEEMAEAKRYWANLERERLRGYGFWQSVHTSVYDITNRVLRVAVQERDDWYTFAVPSSGTDEAKVREIAEGVVAPTRTLASEALDLASNAETHAQMARSAAAAAQSAADQAMTAADDAQSTADQAMTAADDAQSTADQAVSDAASAQQTADAAQSAADYAIEDAAAANTAAEDAWAYADQAVVTADNAETTAEDARDIADAAQATADQAMTDAASAQSTADQAVTDAANAQQTADNATAMISATDPTFSNAVNTVTATTIRREVSAALNTYIDGETGVEYEGKFYGGSLYYVPTGNVYPPNN